MDNLEIFNGTTRHIFVFFDPLVTQSNVNVISSFLSQKAGLLEAPTSSQVSLQTLTKREIEVLQMLALGLGNKEIAKRLIISEHTVKFHMASLMTKLEASSRTEAVIMGIRSGLIPI